MLHFSVYFFLSNTCFLTDLLKHIDNVVAWLHWVHDALALHHAAVAAAAAGDLAAAAAAPLSLCQAEGADGAAVAAAAEALVHARGVCAVWKLRKENYFAISFALN